MMKRGFITILVFWGFLSRAYSQNFDQILGTEDWSAIIPNTGVYDNGSGGMDRPPVFRSDGLISASSYGLSAVQISRGFHDFLITRNVDGSYKLFHPWWGNPSFFVPPDGVVHSPDVNIAIEQRGFTLSLDRFETNREFSAVVVAIHVYPDWKLDEPGPVKTAFVFVTEEARQIIPLGIVDGKHPIKSQWLTPTDWGWTISLPNTPPFELVVNGVSVDKKKVSTPEIELMYYGRTHEIPLESIWKKIETDSNRKLLREFFVHGEPKTPRERVMSGILRASSPRRAVFQHTSEVIKAGRPELHLTQLSGLRSMRQILQRPAPFERTAEMSALMRNLQLVAYQQAAYRNSDTVPSVKLDFNLKPEAFHQALTSYHYTRIDPVSPLLVLPRGNRPANQRSLGRDIQVLRQANQMTSLVLWQNLRDGTRLYHFMPYQLSVHSCREIVRELSRKH